MTSLLGLGKAAKFNETRAIHEIRQVLLNIFTHLSKWIDTPNTLENRSGQDWEFQHKSDLLRPISLNNLFSNRTVTFMLYLSTVSAIKDEHLLCGFLDLLFLIFTLLS